MKKLLTLLFLGLSFLVQSQSIKMNYAGKKVGLSVVSDAGKVLKTLEPKYDELSVFTDIWMGGISLGQKYHSSKYWVDTEFVETPIDPNDPTKTKIETFINESRPYMEGKLIQAKVNGKWGLINMEGEEKVPFVFDEIQQFNSKSLYPYDQKLSPYLVLFSNQNHKIADQNGNFLLEEKQLPVYMKNLGRDKFMDVLEITWFGDFLLINEGGILFDTLIKVPAIKKTVKGKSKVVSAEYSYNQFWFKKGNFNVLQLSTNSFLFPNVHKNIEVHLQDEAGNDFFDPLNVKSYSSITKYQENLKLGLNPGKINFTPID